MALVDNEFNNIRMSVAYSCLTLRSGSFQFNSESQNLKEKSVYLDKLRERVNQKITQYELNIIADTNTNGDFW